MARGWSKTHGGAITPGVSGDAVTLSEGLVRHDDEQLQMRELNLPLHPYKGSAPSSSSSGHRRGGTPSAAKDW
jgi:hypothetical protein